MGWHWTHLFRFAWWVVDDLGWLADDDDLDKRLDRPCDTCDGARWLPAGRLGAQGCSDCGGTGRHCFTIDVEQDRHRTLRVHVVPGMVLPIAGPSDPTPSGTWMYVNFDPSGAGAVMQDGEVAGVHPLPPAAAPGMWAVQLQVVAS